jgi:outer membrane protein, heavy metal efflux system
VSKAVAICCLVALGAQVLNPSVSLADDRPRAVAAAGDGRAQLRQLIDAAKQHAPEVALANASLTSSRSALENGRMAPLGNPYLEVIADRGNKNATKDVQVIGTLWLPVELSGQRGSRGREARDFVSLHAAWVDRARAGAAARVIRAFGFTNVAAERMAVLSELLTSARAESDAINERVRSGDAIQRDASMAAVEAARHDVMLAETRAQLLHAQSELAELVGRDVPEALSPMPPPTLATRDFQVKLATTPTSQALGAESRFYTSSAERLKREGQSPLSVGLLAGRGDLGETRLGGGLAYAFPVFRANRPERARAAAESSRALAEKRVHEAVASRRLKLLEAEQEQLSRAMTTLTGTALPAAQLAVSAVQETYRAGKAEMLAVLLARRELSALSLRRLELLEQNWLLVSEYVEITGELP